MREIRSTGERIGALFLLGLVLFNPLIISVFDAGADARVMGIPLLYLYLFAAWGLLITLVAVAIDRPSNIPAPPPPTVPPGGDEI